MIEITDLSTPTMKNLDRRLKIIRAASFYSRRWGDKVFATVVLQNGERFGSPGSNNEEAIDNVFQLVMEYSSWPNA